MWVKSLGLGLGAGEGIVLGWKARGKRGIKFEVSGRKVDHIPSKA